MADEIQEIDPSQVADLRGANAVLVDVREIYEFQSRAIDGAVNIPLGSISDEIESAIPDKETTVVAYCEHGLRSLAAADELKAMGYENVVSLSGGISQWADEGNPTVKPA